MFVYDLGVHSPIANPNEVLKEYGFENPDWKYVVIEEKDSQLKRYLSLPKKPNSKDMADEDLKQISAGNGGDSG